jgi:hypothetical protein
MFLRKSFSVGLASAIAMLANQANADILFTTGAMAEISAPVSFVTGDNESSTSIDILDEGVSVLASDVELNVYGVGVHGDDPPPYLIVPSGTRVQSYLVHFDPSGSGFATLTGAVFFDLGETVIGIQTHTPLLYTTDGPLGHPLATYPGVFDAFRGFETLPGTDTVTLPPGLGSASFTLFAELGVDHARIFTSPVIPEPSSLALLGLGVAGLCRLVRRR